MISAEFIVTLIANGLILGMILGVILLVLALVFVATESFLEDIFEHRTRREGILLLLKKSAFAAVAIVLFFVLGYIGYIFGLVAPS